MAMLMVNGTAVPAPSEMKVTIASVSSGMKRSASGHGVLDRTSVKRILALRWACMSGEELGALLESVGTGGFFDAAYPDPESGEMRSMTCCAGERTAGMLRMENGAPVWRNIEMTWMER